MTKNNVTSISSGLKKSTATLEDLLQDLQTWRKNKSSNKCTIPSEIWEQIFCLIEQGIMSRSKILKAAGLSTKQLQRAEAEREQVKNTPKQRLNLRKHSIFVRLHNIPWLINLLRPLQRRHLLWSSIGLMVC